MKFPRFNTPQSILSCLNSHSLSKIETSTIKVKIKWLSFDQASDLYETIISNPFKKTEENPYKYIILFNPHALQQHIDAKSIVIEKEEPKPEDLEPELELELEDLESNGLNSGRLDSGRLDSGRLDYDRLDSGRLDYDRLDSKDLDSKDLDSKDLDSKDLDSEDLDSEDLDYHSLEPDLSSNRKQNLRLKPLFRKDWSKYTYKDILIKDKKSGTANFVKNFLLKFNITFEDINALRRFLPQNSYKDPKIEKKLAEIHEDLDYSIRLLRFKPNAQQYFNDNFRVLLRLLKKDYSDSTFFKDLSEKLFLEYNLPVLIKITPQYQFARKTNAKFSRKSLQIGEKIIPVIENEIDLRTWLISVVDSSIRSIQEQAEAKFLKRLIISRLPLGPQHELKPNHQWINVRSLINFILDEFEVGISKLYVQFSYLPVHPDVAFSNFIKDVLTEKRLQSILPGVLHKEFHDILLKEYVNRFYLPNLRRFFRLAFRVINKRYTHAIEEVRKDFVDIPEPLNLQIELTPTETLNDLIIDFRIKSEELQYVLDGLKVQPNNKFLDSVEIVDKNLDVVIEEIKNPYPKLNNKEFFDSISEEGHLSPFFTPFNKDEIEFEEEEEEEEEEEVIIEEVDTYVPNLGEFIALNFLETPPLAPKIFKISPLISDNDKIRVYKVYIGFLSDSIDEENPPVHILSNPIEINLVEDTFYSLVDKFQKEIDITSLKVNNLKKVIAITTYVYYVETQDLVKESILRYILILTKKIGYHWLGIGSKKVFKKRPKLFLFFIPFFIFILFISTNQIFITL